MQRNSFDLVRIALATMVIVGHSFWMVGIADPLPLGGFGEIAVSGFFSLSGYLVSQSARRSNLLSFFWKRGLRVLPGYSVSFWISYLVVGAIGAANAAVYLSSIDWTLNWRFFFELHGPNNLPATFPGQVMPVTNGSMWTIQFEALCYLLTPLLVWRRLPTVFLWAVVTTTAVLVQYRGSSFLAFPHLLAAYCSGVLIADFGMTFRRWHLWFAGAAFVALQVFPATREIGEIIPGSILVIGLGTLPSKFKVPDVSYGTYLYAWPIQNLLILAGVHNPPILIALAIPLSWAAGLASWLLIERYPLRWKKVFRPATVLVPT